MTKVTAGVLTGIALGAAHGVLSAWGEPKAMEMLLSVLGRSSQGIINGVLAAYVAKGRTPAWRAMLLSGAIGLVLGGLAGFPQKNWNQTVPLGAFIGAACGAATARAGRGR
jgi:peptidoglycan/LPS O-acetylase OafA/YrhL